MFEEELMKATELSQRARTFLERRVLPREADWLSKSFSEITPELEELRDEVREAGLWAPCHSKRLGGLGLSYADYAKVSEAIGYSPFGHYLFNCQAPDAGNAELLGEYGTAEQQSRYLHPLIEGKLRSCFGMTEKNTAGSNPTGLRTTARREGDTFVIDGEKWFTTGADGAAFVIVMAVTDPTAAPHLRASMILVPMDTPGLRFVRNVPVMGHVGDGWASHAELRFENCRVPVANLLGPAHQGFVLAQKRLGPGRIQHASRWLGICQRALDALCARAKSREISPGEFLADTQIVRTWVGELATEVTAARLLVTHAAQTIDAAGAKAAQVEIGMAKLYTARVMQKVIDHAIQAHGALGLTDDLVLSFLYRQERAARIYDGADEVHALHIGGKIIANSGQSA